MINLKYCVRFDRGVAGKRAFSRKIIGIVLLTAFVGSSGTMARVPSLSKVGGVIWHAVCTAGKGLDSAAEAVENTVYKGVTSEYAGEWKKWVRESIWKFAEPPLKIGVGALGCAMLLKFVVSCPPALAVFSCCIWPCWRCFLADDLSDVASRSQRCKSKDRGIFCCQVRGTKSFCRV